MAQITHDESSTLTLNMSANNQNKYKKHARQFTYDEKKCILYKKIEDTHGISKQST